MSRIAVPPDIRAPSVDDRILLAKKILESVSEDLGSPELSEEQKEFFRGRLRAYLDNPSDVVGWEQVKQQLAIT